MILVDFRGFDTLGEITVLGVVALTVYALLRRFRPARESIARRAQQRDDDGAARPRRPDDDAAAGYLLVPAVLVRLLLPVAALFAVYLLLRGHNAPGGGFVAGLVLAIGFILQYMAAGTRWVEDAHALAAAALDRASACCSRGGTGRGRARCSPHPFLTTHTAHVDLPLLGDAAPAERAAFDLGVFALVVGATLLHADRARAPVAARRSRARTSPRDRRCRSPR